MAQKKIYELTSHSSIVSTDVFPISDDNSGNAEKQSISGLTTYLATALTGIPSTSISDGSISNTEFGYLNGVTSSIQTQLDGKAATSHTHTTSDITNLSSYTGFDARYYTETETDNLLSAKQATLVSGTNIKTVNGNTLLGSGNLVLGGAVDSVNGQTGVVVLDADDISDTSTTHKFTTAGDISKLAGIEALADVTDATNVASAGAFMKSVDDTDDITEGTTNKYNATHTGEMTGATALTAAPTLVSNKTLKSTLAGTEEVLINDAGTLKKTTAQDIADLASATSGVASVTGTLVDNTDPVNPVINTPDADDIDDTATTNKFATAAEKTKLGFITVTQAVDLDTIETNANNVPGIKTKTDFITVTQAVDLDAIETNSNASKVKTDFITVTQAVDLDTIESDTATNNAKVTNATHTGEVTGSGALTLDKTAITNKSTVTAVSGDFILISDTSDSGNLKKVDALDFLSGGGSGITRSINNISTPTTAGATANTDYVYLTSGTTTVTLPTAVGNTNSYTIKRVGVNTVTINTTSSQTIDGSLTIQLLVQYQSVTLVSDGANWNII